MKIEQIIRQTILVKPFCVQCGKEFEDCLIECRGIKSYVCTRMVCPNFGLIQVDTQTYEN